MNLKVRSNSGKPWTAEQDQATVNMFRQNISIAQIADWQQRSGNSIVSRLVYLGHMAQIGMNYFMVADTPSITVKELRVMENE